MIDTSSVTAWTDGGSGANGHSGAACIIRDTCGNLIVKLTAWLGQATPTEAELAGLIIALCCIESLYKSDSNPSVHWRCDSLPLVHTVETQIGFSEHNTENKTSSSKSSIIRLDAMWKTVATLTQNRSLTANHVRGHRGINDNESCDKACRWMVKSGSKLLSKHGEGLIGRISKYAPRHAWILINAEPFMNGLKNKTIKTKTTTEFCIRVAQLIALRDRKSI